MLDVIHNNVKLANLADCSAETVVGGVNVRN